MTDQVAEWTPAFEGQRPPFPPGHELSLRHGAFSPRKIDPLAEQYAQGLMDHGDAYLRQPVYRAAVWAWARAEAQCQLLTEYLVDKAKAAGNEVGNLDDDATKAAYLLLHRAENRANTLRARLGLDPLSRARLGKDAAAGSLDAARMMAELERQERERQGKGGAE